MPEETVMSELVFTLDEILESLQARYPEKFEGMTVDRFRVNWRPGRNDKHLNKRNKNNQTVHGKYVVTTVHPKGSKVQHPDE